MTTKTPADGHEPHPYERFIAPATIETGSSLADIISPLTVKLIGESFSSVMPEFRTRVFQRRATEGLEELALTQRGEHVGRVLSEFLPNEFADAAHILIRSFGPELQATEGNGLKPFFYLPHSSFIGANGVSDLPAALSACHEITRRFTAEFCIRPLLIADQDQCLKTLRTWTRDPSPHVRRLVSEGTRPRLPWGMHLKSFKQDPTPALALLERLKDDPVLYVRRSVANHLGDVLKDNPEIGYETCDRWLDELDRGRFSAERTASRRWLIRHAVRNPAKKGDSRALDLRQRAADSGSR